MGDKDFVVAFPGSRIFPFIMQTKEFRRKRTIVYDSDDRINHRAPSSDLRTFGHPGANVTFNSLLPLA